MRGTGGTVIGVPANALTLNINFSNKNTSIKANFSLKSQNLILNFLDFLVEISQNFKLFSISICKFNQLIVKLFKFFKTFFKEIKILKIF